MIDSGTLTLGAGQVRTVIAVDAAGGGEPYGVMVLEGLNSRERGSLMLRATSARGYFVLALAAGLSIGCGGTSGTEPSGSIEGLSVVVKSSEWTAQKNLMVVGEDASAQIDPLTSVGCQFPTV